MRDKLIELLKQKYDHYCDQCGVNKQSNYIENLADHLIAHGVTFATDNNVPCKWVPVSESLPVAEWRVFTTDMDWEVYPCLCSVKRTDGIRYATKLFFTGENFVDAEYVRYTEQVTHWMPLPEPPKEGE